MITFPPIAACLGEVTKFRNWYTDLPPTCPKQAKVARQKAIQIVFLNIKKNLAAMPNIPIPNSGNTSQQPNLRYKGDIKKSAQDVNEITNRLFRDWENKIVKKVFKFKYDQDQYNVDFFNGLHRCDFTACWLQR